jgi:hypothetical protein
VRSSARLVSWDGYPIASHWCAVTAYISFCSIFRGDSDVRQLKKHRTSSGEDDSWDYFLFVQTSPSGDCYFEVGSQCARVVLFVVSSPLTEVRELCLPVQFNAVDHAWNMASREVYLFNATKLWLLCSCPLRPTKNGTLGPNYCNQVTFSLDKVEVNLL